MAASPVLAWPCCPAFSPGTSGETQPCVLPIFSVVHVRSLQPLLQTIVRPLEAPLATRPSPFVLFGSARRTSVALPHDKNCRNFSVHIGEDSASVERRLLHPTEIAPAVCCTCLLQQCSMCPLLCSLSPLWPTLDWQQPLMKQQLQCFINSNDIGHK